MSTFRFPENLRDPMNADSASVGFEDLALVFSQSVDLGRFAVPAALRAARALEKTSDSGFKSVRIRISQCESLGPLGVPRAFVSIHINRSKIKRCPCCSYKPGKNSSCAAQFRVTEAAILVEFPFVRSHIV
jgi:hypothetical protein